MNGPCAADQTNPPSLSYMDMFAVPREGRRTFLAVVLAGSLLTAVATFSWPRLYSATTVLLPPQQQQSAAANALAQLGGLSGLAGAAAGIKAPDELYVGLLKTRRLQDALLERFDLKRHYDVDTAMDARRKLASRVSIVADRKSGLITLEVDDEDAALAANLANAHVEELRRLLSTLAVTEAQQRRAFFDQQVDKARTALDQAELAFRKAQAESGMAVSQALAESNVKVGIELRAQIAAREVQLQALNRFVTPENPEAARLAAQVAALREQLARIEGGSGSGRPEAGTPRGIEAVRAYRNLKVQEASLEALIRQAEIARVDEAREGPLLQQVDPATPPERATKPRRSMIAASGIALSVCLGFVVAMLRGRRAARVALSPVVSS